MILFLPRGLTFKGAIDLRTREDISKNCGIQLSLGEAIRFETDLALVMLNVHEWHRSAVYCLVHSGELSPEQKKAVNDSLLIRPYTAYGSLTLKDVVEEMCCEMMRGVGSVRSETLDMPRPVKVPSNAALYHVRALGEDEDLPEDAVQLRTLMSVKSAVSESGSSFYPFKNPVNVLVNSVLLDVMSSIFSYKSIVGERPVEVSTTINYKLDEVSSGGIELDKASLYEAALEVNELPLDRMYFVMQKFLGPMRERWAKGRKKSEKAFYLALSKVSKVSLQQFIARARPAIDYAVQRMCWYADRECPKDLQNVDIPTGGKGDPIVFLLSKAEDPGITKLKQRIMHNLHDMLKSEDATPERIKACLDMRDVFDAHTRALLKDACHSLVSRGLVEASFMPSYSMKAILDYLLK